MGISLDKAHRQIKENRIKREVLKSAEKDIISNVTAGMNAVWILALHDEFGFGAARIRRAIEKVTINFQCLVDDKYLTMDDIYKTIEDELGITAKEINR